MGNIFENGSRKLCKKHTELSVSASENGLFVWSYVAKGTMEAGPLSIPENTGTGAADEFERRKDRKQCKIRKQDRPHEPE